MGSCVTSNLRNAARIAIRRAAVALVALAAVLGLLLNAGCFGRGGVRHVILISIDTCRADHLSCYGFPRPTTPHLDTLAQDGIRFTHAATTVPLTLPAHCSMLTGTTPLAHGVHDNSNYRLDDSKTTVAEILRDAGWRTAGIVGAMVLSKRFNLCQGFQSWDDQFGSPATPGAPAPSERRAGDVTRLASAWLEQNHAAPKFFLFLHYYDPHVAYDPPEPYATTFHDDLYSGEIAYTDAEIGRLFDLLKRLGLYDNSLIIVTGDHGEGLGEHGEAAHDYFIYQSTVHIPLIVKPPANLRRLYKLAQPAPGSSPGEGPAPGSSAGDVAGSGSGRGRVVDAPVCITDIVPTILRQARLAVPSWLQGEDLLGGLEAGKGAAPTPETRSLYCESLSPTRYGCNPLFGILDGRWKYILSTRPELYNLEADPGETKDLIQQEPGRADLLRGKLQTLMGALRVSDQASGRATPDEETQERLRSLGYISGSSMHETFTVDPARPDAKDRIGAHVAFGDAIRLEGERKLDQARAVVADLEQRYPGLTDVEMFRGLIEFESGNAKEAVSHYEAGLALMEKEAAGRSAMTVNPDLASGHYQLANALAETDRKEDALNEYHEAIHLNGRYVDAWFNLGVTLAQMGRVDEAVSAFTETLKLQPDHAEAHYNLAIAALTRSEPDEANRHLAEALRIRPDYPEAHAAMGDLLASQNRLPDAAQQYSEALKANPDFTVARCKLARVLMGEGNAEEAVSMYRTAIQAMPDQPAIAGELAWILATHPDARIRNGAEAVRLAEAACRKAPPLQQPTLVATLAAAYAEAGRFDDAVRAQQKALELARAAGQENLVPAIEARIAQFKQRQPVRGRF